jgi:heme/copper-type cytochrome/quinol oxidase subunit 4
LADPTPFRAAAISFALASLILTELAKVIVEKKMTTRAVNVLMVFILTP